MGMLLGSPVRIPLLTVVIASLVLAPHSARAEPPASPPPPPPARETDLFCTTIAGTVWCDYVYYRNHCPVACATGAPPIAPPHMASPLPPLPSPPSPPSPPPPPASLDAPTTAHVAALASQYQHMVLVAMVYVDGLIAETGVLAAYSGNDLRGVGDYILLIPAGPYANHHSFHMMVYGNNGDPISFRLWRENEPVAYLSYNMTLQAGGTFGSVISPLVIGIPSSPPQAPSPPAPRSVASSGMIQAAASRLRPFSSPRAARDEQLRPSGTTRR